MHFREYEIPYLLEVYSGKHGDKIRVVHECPLYEYPYKACNNKEGTEKVACVLHVYPAVSNDKIGYVCVVESEYTRDYEMDSEISILAFVASWAWPDFIINYLRDEDKAQNVAIARKYYRNAARMLKRAIESMPDKGSHGNLQILLDTLEQSFTIENLEASRKLARTFWDDMNPSFLDTFAWNIRESEKFLYRSVNLYNF